MPWVSLRVRSTNFSHPKSCCFLRFWKTSTRSALLRHRRPCRKLRNCHLRTVRLKRYLPLAVGCLIKGKGIFSSDQSKSILGNSITVGTLALNLVMGVVFLLVLYAFGWAWLSYMGNLSAEAAFVMAVAPFVPIDAIKMFAAVLLAQAVSKVIK